MAGTIAYMAPEQIEAHPRPASDQYSLGIVVYEWLSGDRPFHGSFTEIAIKHSVVPPPPLREKVPELSPVVEQVVLTALAKDPKERFGSVQAFATAFEQASQVSLGKTKPPGRSQQFNDTTTPPDQSQQPTKLATAPGESSIPTKLPNPTSQMLTPKELVPTELAVISTAARVNLIPLGLGAFTVTTFVLSVADAGLFNTFAIIRRPGSPLWMWRYCTDHCWPAGIKNRQRFCCYCSLLLWGVLACRRFLHLAASAAKCYSRGLLPFRLDYFHQPAAH